MEGRIACSPLGDITNLKENKMALHIAGQLSVAEANIRAVALGRTPAKTYKAKTGNRMMASHWAVGQALSSLRRSRKPFVRPG